MIITTTAQVVDDKEGRTVFSVKAIVCADASEDGAKTIVCHQEGKVTHFTWLYFWILMFKQERSCLEILAPTDALYVTITIRPDRSAPQCLLFYSVQRPMSQQSFRITAIVSLQLKATHTTQTTQVHNF